MEDFNGKVKWKVFKDVLSRRGNYLLTISIMEEMHNEFVGKEENYNQKQYFGEEKFKLYCEQAVEDIPLLAKHIEKSFKIKHIKEN